MITKVGIRVSYMNFTITRRPCMWMVRVLMRREFHILVRQYRTEVTAAESREAVILMFGAWKTYANPSFSCDKRLICIQVDIAHFLRLHK